MNGLRRVEYPLGVWVVIANNVMIQVFSCYCWYFVIFNALDDDVNEEVLSGYGDEGSSVLCGCFVVVTWWSRYFRSAAEVCVYVLSSWRCGRVVGWAEATPRTIHGWSWWVSYTKNEDITILEDKPVLLQTGHSTSKSFIYFQ